MRNAKERLLYVNLLIVVMKILQVELNQSNFLLTFTELYDTINILGIISGQSRVPERERGRGKKARSE